VPDTLLHLQVEYIVFVVVVGCLRETVVTPKAVYISCKRGEIRTGKYFSFGAHDTFYHAVYIRVDALSILGKKKKKR
jgi:hypothetical protein